jgi:hypothetical protein
MSHKTRRAAAELPPHGDAALPAWMRLAGYALIVVVTLVAMAPLNDAQFVSMDDPGTIAQNRRLNPPTAETLKFYWTTPAHALYIPVTYTVWAALAAVAREPNASANALDPGVFHVANAIFHVLAALLVAAILRLLLKRDWPAIAGALLFAVHPLQVESVGWASGTKDVLCGTFSFAAILLYLLHRRWTYAAALACFVLALLSKPTAMTVPAIACVLDCLIVRRPWRVAARALAPWLLIALAAMIVARLVQPALRVESPPLWARPFLVGDSLTFYLAKLVFPFRLAVCYGRTSDDLMRHAWFWLAWLVPATIALLLWMYGRRQLALVAAAIVFVIALSPMLGLVKFDYQYFSTTSDHYVYVAMLGPALAIAWAARRFRSKVVAPIIAAIIAVLAVQTNLQARVWHDDVSLFERSLAVAPRGVLALHNLGNYWTSHGQPQRAVGYFESALAVRPVHDESMLMLGVTLAKLDRGDEAIGWLVKFLDRQESLPTELRAPAYPDLLFTVAETLLKRGDFAQAATYFRRRVELRPNDAIAQRDLLIAEQHLAAAAATRPSQSR